MTTHTTAKKSKYAVKLLSHNLKKEPRSKDMNSFFYFLMKQRLLSIRPAGSRNRAQTTHIQQLNVWSNGLPRSACRWDTNMLVHVLKHALNLQLLIRFFSIAYKQRITRISNSFKLSIDLHTYIRIAIAHNQSHLIKYNSS